MDLEAVGSVRGDWFGHVPFYILKKKDLEQIKQTNKISKTVTFLQQTFYLIRIRIRSPNTNKNK